MTILPSRYIIAVGTYDGVIAGWDSSSLANSMSSSSSSTSSSISSSSTTSFTADKIAKISSSKELQLTFAMPSHEGSVRSISLSPPSKTENYNPSIPPLMVSAGFDELVKIYSLSKRIELGETRTPPTCGTPTTSCYTSSSHLSIGTNTGKIIVYETKGYQTLHVMGGHTSGITSLIAHPKSNGGLLLSCSSGDGTIRLWDMLKGRCAYVSKIHPGVGSSSTSVKSSKSHDPNSTLSCLKFSPSGSSYAYAYGKRLVVKDTNTGDTLLDVPDLGAKINDICFTGKIAENLVCCAMNDGGVCMFMVSEVVKGTMAVPPTMTGAKSGESRLKRIESLPGGSGCLVVASNSAGVVTVWDLEGPARSLVEEEGEEVDPDADSEEDADGGSSDGDEESGDNEAVIVHKVRLGTGARIMCIGVWSSEMEIDEEEEESEEEDEEEEEEEVEEDGDSAADEDEQPTKKRYAQEAAPTSAKRGKGGGFERLQLRADQKSAVLDDEEKVKRARELISKAKAIKKKSDKKAKAKK